jgi:hypothetical protein
LRGRIYFHNDFGFHDGDSGKKFLILINNPQKLEPYIFIKTTTQQKNKPSVEGCHIKEKVFYVPSGRSFFPKNTWVQLHEIYAFAPTKLIADGINKTLIHKSKLTEQMINTIVNCLLKSSIEDIDPEYIKLIKKK